jgi:3-hydroxyisobutyrate dehydrogenase
VTGTRVAVLGLGRMGGPIADHIIAAGHKVTVYDVDPAAMAPRIEAGATTASSAADAASHAQFVHVVVFDDEQVLAVMTGSKGALSTLERGAVVCVHTTVSLDTVRDLASRSAAEGVTVLDAGISGGEPGAAAGTLLTMVGGPVDAVQRVKPILDAFSKEVIHAGDIGAGMALKLARNAAGFVMMAAVHEAMELACRSGIDLDLLRHAIAETGVLDQALAPFFFGGPDPLSDDAPDPLRGLLERTNRLAEKDLDQALVLAKTVGATVPVIEAVRQSFARVVRL